MSELLLATFEPEVAAQVVAPDFDYLVTQANRRRRASYAAAGVAATAAVAGAVAGAVAVDQQPSSSDEPTPPISTSTSQADRPLSSLSAEEIVNDPDAQTYDFAVSADDPDKRAYVWRLCSDPYCSEQVEALAVTADGYGTAAYLALPAEQEIDITALQDGAFFVDAGPDFQQVVTANGVPGPIFFHLGLPYPKLPNESLVTWVQGERRSRAIGPGATAHAIPVPHDSQLGTYDDGNGHLLALRGIGVGVSPDWAVYTSSDGGAHWRLAQLPTPRDSAFFVGIQAAQDGVAALLELADPDDASLVASWRSIDGGSSWQRIESSIDGADGDEGHVSGALVLPDGRLLVSIEDWSDATKGTPSEHPYGLYVSDGDDWSHLSWLPSPLPTDAAPGALLAEPLGAFKATVDGSTARLWIQTDTDHAFYTDVTADSGVIGDWMEVPTR